MTVSIHLGDCLDVMPTLPAKSVDMVLADLPYGTTRAHWDSQIPLAPLWAEYARICRGPIVLFAQTPFDKVLGASNLKALRYEWIWEKTNATGHLNANRAPLKAHENILVFYGRQPPYHPIKTTGHPRKVSKGGSRPSSVYGDHATLDRNYDSTERYPRSVLTFPSDKQRSKLHGTQKPVALCEYLIRTYTDPGAVVLDNCMGSGTTGVACLNTDRSFIGIEQDPAIFSVAQARLAADRPAPQVFIHHAAPKGERRQPIRSCADCGQAIGQHGKWKLAQRGGVLTPVHRHCDNPDSHFPKGAEQAAPAPLLDWMAA